MRQLNIYQSVDCNKESIKKNFIIRQKELKEITNVLHQYSKNSPLQHELILGKRGSGKTVLLKRIEIEIEEKLSKKFIPVFLAEEQASIYRVFDLWIEIINDLKSRFDYQPEIKDYQEFGNDEDFTRYLYGFIHEFCTSKNKQIVLLLDNFDRIIDNFTYAEDLLLETFINYDDILIIASSMKMKEYLMQDNKHFYELFRLHYMEALTIDDIKELFNQWAETVNKPELKKFVDKNQGKLQNIRIITDNLPRTFIFFVQLIVQNSYINEDVDYVQKIMDNFTPIYQERLNNLPPQLRKMVVEMAFIWEACTTKELVYKCKMESKLISANLKTLSDKGIVNKIETDKRNLLYSISERFFNIWLIMTQGNFEQKQKAKNLNIFLENWYDIAYLKTMPQKYISGIKRRNINEIRGNKKTIKFAYSHENEDDGYNPFDLGSINRIQTIYSEAEKYFLSEISKGKVAAMFNLGNYYANQEKLEEAENYYLLAIEKGHISAMYNLGVLYAKEDNFQKAEKYFLLAVDKGDANAMYNLGVLYANHGKDENAEKNYLLATKRGHVSAMHNLGNLFYRENKFEEAEKYYHLATKCGHVGAMYNLGNLYANTGKFTEAEKYYLLAIEKENVDAMCNLGNLYANQGKFIEVEKYFLLAVKNGNIDAMNNLGIMYYHQDKFSEAEKYFLLAIEKENVNAIHNLGLLYTGQGKLSKAEKFYSLAIEKNHNNALYNLASLYYQQNKNKEEALSIISKYEGCGDLGIIIELWNGIFNDIVKRTLEVVKEDPDTLFWFIINLLIHQQKALVLNLFNYPESGKSLQDKFKVLHYVSLLLSNKSKNNIYLRIPPEIKSTINEVISYIEEKEKFYGYI